MTIHDVAKNLGVSWGMIKDIDYNYLKCKYSSPDIRNVERISIDEFAVHKGHKYMTVVYDLDHHRAIYVGEGKDMEALKPFWKKVNKAGVKFKAISTDMSRAFIASVLENQIDTPLVFDRFHLVKLLNEQLSDLRRDLYNQETDVEKKELLKGTRWLLLKKEENLSVEKDEKQKLQEALEVNKPLATAYYLKEELSLFWQKENKSKADKVL